MADDIKKLAMEWVLDANPINLPESYYCATRDIFQARLDNMSVDLKANGGTGEGDVYMLAALAGEIGNNSFDHNIGNWPDIVGVFFGWQINGGVRIVLADRGRGLAQTLKKVKPEITGEQDALQVAFFEKISGRAPENRGNGLKFVREGVKGLNAHLVFISGNAKAELNQDFNVGLAEKNIHGCLAVIKMQKYEN